MSGAAAFVFVMLLAFFGLAWWNDRHGEGRRRRRDGGGDGGGDSGHGADDGCDGGDGGD